MYLIADIGSNHNGDLERAKKLIHMAKHSGADAVKFQMFQAEQLYYKPMAKLIERELPRDWIPLLCDHTNWLNINFGCTAFDLDSLEYISDYVDFQKISSFDILRRDMIFFAATKAKECDQPLIISTGLADRNEINNIVNFCKKEVGIIPQLLHCVSKYPAVPAECHLEQIVGMWNMYTCPIGWSDHTKSVGVILRTIAHGAVTIEVHMDLEDGQGWEYEHGHCWKPSELRNLVEEIRNFQSSSQPEYLTKSLFIDNMKAGKDLSQRADPSDGKRPMIYAREETNEAGNNS